MWSSTASASSSLPSGQRPVAIGSVSWSATSRRRAARPTYAARDGATSTPGSTAADLPGVADASGFAGSRRPGAGRPRRPRDASAPTSTTQLTSTERKRRDSPAVGTRPGPSSPASPGAPATSRVPSSSCAASSAPSSSIDTDELPFAGELLDVADEHAAWRGAAERVLRGFALSMLVPAASTTRRVSPWVNERRLVQHRADGAPPVCGWSTSGCRRGGCGCSPAASSGGLLLADVVVVRDGTFTRLPVRRADQARRPPVRGVDRGVPPRETRAVTREGQVRSRERHEKDDRGRVDDPRSWVLGWVNEQKVAALHAQLGPAAVPAIARRRQPGHGCSVDRDRATSRARRWRPSRRTPPGLISTTRKPRRAPMPRRRRARPPPGRIDASSSRSSDAWGRTPRRGADDRPRPRSADRRHPSARRPHREAPSESAPRTSPRRRSDPAVAATARARRTTTSWCRLGDALPTASEDCAAARPSS